MAALHVYNDSLSDDRICCMLNMKGNDHEPMGNDHEPMGKVEENLQIPSIYGPQCDSLLSKKQTENELCENSYAILRDLAQICILSTSEDRGPRDTFTLNLVTNAIQS